MKKYIYAIAFLPMLGLWACSADEGTMPGTDKEPVVTVYTYAPTDPALNPDNDVTVRFATNSATTDVYYMYQLTTEVDAEVEKNEAAFIDKVISTGQKISVNGAENVEINLIDIHGANTICAVAVGNGGKTLGSATFLGLDWEQKKLGTFYIQQAFIGTKSTEAALEVCTTDPSLYRIKDAFGEGYSMKMQLLNKQGQDEDGVYTLFRIPATHTPWKVKLQNGTTPDLWVQDIGYWQGNASFVTDVTGYENGFYKDDGSAFFRIAWMAGDMGCVSYDTPSYFVPYE
ncbi:hypothetical protein EEL33_07700 [Muribaculaceae bacterium Isolate-037 (Harlan)]|jgi:hypothetical protein|nr:hypothetical protein EEL33_07700 [Muribaculaceae bacterium Isolate-037 (Harlan)]